MLHFTARLLILGPTLIADVTVALLVWAFHEEDIIKV